MGHQRTAEAEQSTRQLEEHQRGEPPHVLRDGSFSAEEVRHVSGDQGDLVDCKDHVRTTPHERQKWISKCGGIQDKHTMLMDGWQRGREDRNLRDSQHVFSQAKVG